MLFRSGGHLRLTGSSVCRIPLSPVGAVARTYPAFNPRLFDRFAQLSELPVCLGATYGLAYGSLRSAASTVANILASSATSCLQQDTPRILVIRMTAALAHIVEEIEVLTPGEKIELRRHIVERIPWSPDLDEDDYAALSAASFRALDEEEDRGA